MLKSLKMFCCESTFIEMFIYKTTIETAPGHQLKPLTYLKEIQFLTKAHSICHYYIFLYFTAYKREKM